ncbi:MAG: radical SAM protein [Patescibacteria group bacterium]|jgi:uncharacterized protein
MDKVFRLSDFCHYVEVGEGMVALYNSLTAGVLFLRKDLSDLLKNSTGGVIRESVLFSIDGNRCSLLNSLIERRLIMPIGERYDIDDYLRMQNLLKENGVGILYLLATDGCNLGCSYCYIENVLPKDYQFSLMSKETAKQGIDLFARSLSRTIEEPHVILYGGEPLLNPEVVHWSIDYVLRLKDDGTLPEKTGITINTNATLISRDFIDFLADKKVQIAVSLDGKKEMHDMMRRDKEGRGTYDKVIRNCRMMAEQSIDFGFSVTITKANIHRLEDVIIWLHKTFNINSVGFNIVIDRSEALIGMSELEYATLVTEKLINCFEICREKGIYEDRIMRKVDSFIDGYPYLYDCGAPGDQLVISPDRMVGVCQAYCGTKKNFVALDELDNPADHPIWQEWRFRSPIHQRQCYDCISIGICGGGCPYNAELKTGSIWGLDNTFCVHSKGTVNYLIQKLYQETKKS